MSCWLYTPPAWRAVTARLSCRTPSYIRRRNQMVKDPPIRGVAAAWSLTQFKNKLQDMNTKGYGPKEYVCFNAKLVQVDMTVTILRHNSTCRGVIKHGRCCMCGVEQEII